MLPVISEIDKLTINKLTIEIGHYKRETAKNLIEIGMRLIKVKELLPHGDWGKWVEENVEFSQNTAGQFMRIAREFSNSGSVKNFSTKQLYLLLEIPQEEREEFIQHPHALPSGELKTVDKMTTRELQEAVKAQKLAEKQAKKAQSYVDDYVALEVQRLSDNLINQLPPQPMGATEKLKTKLEKQNAELQSLKKTRLSNKDKQKVKKMVKADAKLLIKELVKNAKKLKSDYVREFDQKGSDQQIELAAKACDRIAEELRSLIHTTEKPSLS